MSFVTNLVLHRIKTHLTQKLQTEIPVDDPTRADTVKIGRFQDDPLVSNIYISISGGSQTDPELIDGIVSIRDFDKIGVNLPPREVGGGQLWWRRGEIKVGCFFVTDGYAEEQAAEMAYEVFGRVMNNIENIRVSDLVDTHGEQALKLFCFASAMMESGGPPDRYIWRGTIKWQFLSERR